MIAAAKTSETNEITTLWAGTRFARQVRLITRSYVFVGLNDNKGQTTGVQVRIAYEDDGRIYWGVCQEIGGKAITKGTKGSIGYPIDEHHTEERVMAGIKWAMRLFESRFERRFLQVLSPM